MSVDDDASLARFVVQQLNRPPAIGCWIGFGYIDDINLSELKYLIKIPLLIARMAFGADLIEHSVDSRWFHCAFQQRTKFFLRKTSSNVKHYCHLFFIRKSLATSLRNEITRSTLFIHQQFFFFLLCAYLSKKDVEEKMRVKEVFFLCFFFVFIRHPGAVFTSKEFLTRN